MTISTTIVKNSYSGDGSTATFSYTFKVLAESDLTVIIRSALGTETTKTLTTHYTITGVGDAAGGSITFTAGNIPSATETVVLLRDTTQTQAIDYVANDPFPAESHEEGLDRSVILSQEIQEEVDRSIKLSRTNTMTNTEFTVGPSDRANKVLSFDSSGELSVTQELGVFKGNWSASETYAVRDLVKDTTNNNIYICQTAHTSSGSLPLSSNTDIGKWSLIVDAAAATTSATAAASSATDAETAQTAAETAQTAAETAQTAAELAETNAETAETNAAASATASASSATAAAASASAAEATFDNFDDSYLGSKASNPTLDNDGNALQDGALYFDTTNNVMKVYDLGTTTWFQLTPTVSNQTNINTVAGISADVTAVAADATDIGTVATNLTGTNTIGTVAGSIANVNLVGGSITNVNTVATNLASVNNFGEVYRISATAPTTSLNSGDLYFDTTTNILNVYGASGWQNAGSSVNGTSQRYNYTATASQTTFTGVDNNGNTLTYDAGYIDVYLNGVKLLNGTDVTVSSGTSVVLATGATAGDIVDIVAYGTFSVASLNADNLDSGTVPDGRITGAYTGITNLTMSGDLTINDGNKIQLTKNTVSSGDSLGIIEFHDEDGFTGANAGEFRIEGTRGDDKDSPNLKFIGADAGGVLQDRLVIQGTTGNVGIGTASPNATLNIQSSTDASIDIDATSGSTQDAFIKFTSPDNGTVYLGVDDSEQLFKINNTSALSSANHFVINTSGAIMVGATSDSNNTDGVVMRSSSHTFRVTSDSQPMVVNRRIDGNLIGFLGNGTTEGTISISGTTVSYNGFTGTHWSRFTDNSTPTILKGTVLESLDEMCDWYNLEFDVTTTTQDEDGNDVTNTVTEKVPHVLTDTQSVGDVITYNHEGTDYQATIVKENDVKHMKSKVSDTVDAKNVYGVFIDYDNDGDGYNDFYVASVGSFVVRIKANETIAKGDLLQSNGDGTAKVQTDDNVKSSSFAKVLSTTIIETYEDGSYLVPCSLMC